MLACQKAIDSGKDVRYLVTVRPKNSESYMFHSANLDAVPVIAQARRDGVRGDHNPWEKGGRTRRS